MELAQYQEYEKSCAICSHIVDTSRPTIGSADGSSDASLSLAVSIALKNWRQVIHQIFGPLKNYLMFKKTK